MRDGKTLKFPDMLTWAALFSVAVWSAPSPVLAQSAFEDPGLPQASGATGTGLVAVSPVMDAGEVIIGSSAQVVALFRNEGSKPVSVGAISLYPSSGISASVAVNQCAQEPLESGAVCAIALNIKGLQPGAYRLEMLIRHDGKSKLINAIVNGNVESTGDAISDLVSDIEPVPSEIDFATVSSSRPQVRSIILRNITSKAIDISEIFIEASPQSGFTLKTDCQKLEAGQACLASVTWAPAQEGADSGVIVLRHSGPTAISSIPISGEYTPETATQAEVFPTAVPGKGLLVSSQTEVDFGSAVQSKSSITVSLVNIGDEPLTLNDIRLNNLDNGIVFSKSGCKPGLLLDPVEACPLTLEWEPLREGEVVDDIQVLHTGARGILVLPLRGTATKAVNKDNKAVVISTALSDQGLLRAIPKVSEEEVGGLSEKTDAEAAREKAQKNFQAEVTAVKARQPVDVSGILDNFSITSLAPDRAIIAGPGGSRVILDNQEAVIGGVLWDVNVRTSSVEFTSGDQRVLLLFDKSLSSVNSTGAQSTNTSTTATTATDNN